MIPFEICFCFCFLFLFLFCFLQVLLFSTILFCILLRICEVFPLQQLFAAVWVVLLLLLVYCAHNSSRVNLLLLLLLSSPCIAKFLQCKFLVADSLARTAFAEWREVRECWMALHSSKIWQITWITHSAVYFSSTKCAGNVFQLGSTSIFLNNSPIELF